MQVLEKIMEEIESEYLMCRCQNNKVCDYPESIGCCYDRAIGKVLDIIRNHMNDGWVSVEERVPKEEGYKVLVCSKKGNIDTGIYSPYTKQWFIGNISALGKDIIAWRPLPEPYHPERSEHDR